MLREIRKENPELAHTLIELRRASKTHSAPVWATAAERLARPRHQVTPVNVGHLERLAKPDETIVVPGKLLAEGKIQKKLTVAAFAFSAEAKSKIHAAGGQTLTIHELLKSKPDGAGVRIFG
jgi:large subunit ribosomal protein L18e